MVDCVYCKVGFFLNILVFYEVYGIGIVVGDWVELEILLYILVMN